LEYVLDGPDGDIKLFDTKDDAIQFLKEAGATEENIYFMVFEDVPIKGDIVEYTATDGSGRMERATVLEVFENMDIRTDMDGVRCRGEYTRFQNKEK
jgi:hypothetical protein